MQKYSPESLKHSELYSVFHTLDEVAFHRKIAIYPKFILSFAPLDAILRSRLLLHDTFAERKEREREGFSLFEKATYNIGYE